MTRTYCDICGKETSNNYTAPVYQINMSVKESGHPAHRSKLWADVCCQCAQSVISHIQRRTCVTEEYIPIRDFAVEAGVSRQAVYVRLNDPVITPYVKTDREGHKVINRNALTFFNTKSALI